MCLCSFSGLLRDDLVSQVPPSAACGPFSMQQPEGCCENIMYIMFLLGVHGRSHFSLCFLTPPLSLWVQFLLFSSCSFSSRHTRFPVSLQTSRFNPASEPLQFTLMRMYPHGSLFHFLQVFAFHWGLFGYSVMVATLALPSPSSCFVFLHSIYNFLIYYVGDIYFG